MAHPQRQHVLGWLRNLPSTYETLKTLETPLIFETPSAGARAKRTQPHLADRDAKRQRIIPSPSPSISTSTPIDMPAPPSKRSLDMSEVSEASFDTARAPRSNKSHRMPPWGFPPSTASSRRSASPKKQSRASASSHALTQQFDFDKDIPESLKSLWRSLDRFERGIGIISHAHRNAIHDARQTVPQYKEDAFEDFFFEPGPTSQDAAAAVGHVGPRTALGPTPSVDEVVDILQRARYCRDELVDEATWNMMVHVQILQIALGAPWKKQQELVSFVPCTSASIMPEYTDTGGRKIDFCLVVRPDPTATLAIRSLGEQDYLANISINHTDYPLLQAQPIVLSIESKNHGEGSSNAESQLLTWHAAQWRVLERLVSRAEPELDLPDFLTGLIVQGHEWSFVASTKRGDQVILWTTQRIGSTARVAGVYQIVTALQHLRRWTEEEYWPWYRRAVLRLDSSEPGL